MPACCRMRLAALSVFSATFFLATCSTIDTAYYARPEDQFLSSEKCVSRTRESDEIPCAKLKVDGIEIVYWAGTEYHTTMRGPCLLPFYPVGAPILESFDLHLFWRIVLPPGLKANPPAVSILPASLMASAAGRLDKPTGLTIYRFENGLDNIEKTMSFYQDFEPVPESIPIPGDVTIDMWYNTIFYAETSSFSVQPVFRIHGKEVKGPRIIFTTDMDRKYTPYEFPFMIPVR